MRALGLVLLVLVGLAPSVAVAQTPTEDFVPVGYKFCGWENLGRGTWTFGEPEAGAWLRLFARQLDCTAARRHYKRVRYSQLPPFRPLRSGYRCKALDNDYEYTDVRCAKRGQTAVAFRWQTGS